MLIIFIQFPLHDGKGRHCPCNEWCLCLFGCWVKHKSVWSLTNVILKQVIWPHCVYSVLLQEISVLGNGARGQGYRVNMRLVNDMKYMWKYCLQKPQSTIVWLISLRWSFSFGATVKNLSGNYMNSNFSVHTFCSAGSYSSWLLHIHLSRACMYF